MSILDESYTALLRSAKWPLCLAHGQLKDARGVVLARIKQPATVVDTMVAYWLYLHETFQNASHEADRMFPYRLAQLAVLEQARAFEIGLCHLWAQHAHRAELSIRHPGTLLRARHLVGTLLGLVKLHNLKLSLIVDRSGLAIETREMLPSEHLKALVAASTIDHVVTTLRRTEDASVRPPKARSIPAAAA